MRKKERYLILSLIFVAAARASPAAPSTLWPKPASVSIPLLEMEYTKKSDSD